MTKNETINDIGKTLKDNKLYVTFDYLTVSDNNLGETDLVINKLDNCWTHSILEFASDDLSYVITYKALPSKYAESIF